MGLESPHQDAASPNIMEVTLNYTGKTLITVLAEVTFCQRGLRESDGNIPGLAMPARPGINGPGDWLTPHNP